MFLTVIVGMGCLLGTIMVLFWYRFNGECGMRNAECGLRSAECGTRLVDGVPFYS